jgi:hypothetical protein
MESLNQVSLEAGCGDGMEQFANMCEACMKHLPEMQNELAAALKADGKPKPGKPRSRVWSGMECYGVLNQKTARK